MGLVPAAGAASGGHQSAPATPSLLLQPSAVATPGSDSPTPEWLRRVQDPGYPRACLLYTSPSPRD
eukprot:14013865-Alexandrium_andersonii.AAC.1